MERLLVYLEAFACVDVDEVGAALLLSVGANAGWVGARTGVYFVPLAVVLVATIKGDSSS